MAVAEITASRRKVHVFCPEMVAEPGAKGSIGTVLASLFHGWQEMRRASRGVRDDDVASALFEIEDAIAAQPARTLKDMAIKIVVADSDEEISLAGTMGESLVKEARNILKARV